MGYELVPNNNIEQYKFGAFSWPLVLVACGYLFPAVKLENGGWEMAGNANELDARFPADITYPLTLTNDGFKITDEEAKIMARCARNYVAIKRGYPEDERIRSDFLDRIEAFANWAEKSGGFSID